MAAYRFRAQAALNLRRRELEVTQRHLALVEGDRDLARARLEAAALELERARAAWTARGRRPGSPVELQWHQSWILRLDYERRGFATVHLAREAQVTAASDACRTARQRYESLEKLRHRARAAHDAADATAERKMLDELATRRFAAKRLRA